MELLIAVINSRADEHIISSKAIKFSRSAYPSKSFVVILDFFANTLCNLFTDFEKLLISFSKAFDATFTYPSAGFPLVGLSLASIRIIFNQFKEKIAYFWTAYRYDSLNILNSKNFRNYSYVVAKVVVFHFLQNFMQHIYAWSFIRFNHPTLLYDMFKLWTPL